MVLFDFIFSLCNGRVFLHRVIVTAEKMDAETKLWTRDHVSKAKI